MFATPTLAATIDRAEGRLCAAIAGFSAAGPHGADVRVTDVSGGVAVFTRRGSPINKLIAAGFDGPIDLDALAAVERHFAERAARLQAEVSTLADPELHKLLVHRGFTPSGFENVLGHPLSAIGSVPNGVEVTVAQPGDYPVLARTVAGAFAAPDHGGVGGDATPPSDELERWLETTSKIDGFRGYLARMNGTVAGGASMRLDGQIAQFSGAGTLPSFRRRGVQTALLRARLLEAAAAGCTVGVIVTQPASKSQQNAQREGFSLLYARQLLVKTPAPDQRLGSA